MSFRTPMFTPEQDKRLVDAIKEALDNSKDGDTPERIARRLCDKNRRLYTSMARADAWPRFIDRVRKKMRSADPSPTQFDLFAHLPQFADLPKRILIGGRLRHFGPLTPTELRVAAEERANRAAARGSRITKELLDLAAAVDRLGANATVRDYVMATRVTVVAVAGS